MSGMGAWEGVFTVKSNASWVMVTWDPPPCGQNDGQIRLKEERGQPIIYTNPLKSTRNKNTIAFSSRGYSLIFKTQCNCIGINDRCWCLRYVLQIRRPPARAVCAPSHVPRRCMNRPSPRPRFLYSAWTTSSTRASTYYSRNTGSKCIAEVSISRPEVIPFYRK